MNDQRHLFPRPIVECATCGWNWREGDRAPKEHDSCVKRVAARKVLAVNGKRTPLKKWRCSGCWARFASPRAERAPLCRECLDGQETLFGGRACLVPKNALPLGSKKARRV